MKNIFLNNFLIFKQGVHFIFNNFIKPKSRNEDLKRREFILNILLSGSLFLSAVSTIKLIHDVAILGKYHTGVSPFLLLAIFLFFCFLLFLSRKGCFIISSYLFLIVYFSPILFTFYNKGTIVPQVILALAMLIIMSGILINAKSSFIITFIISFLLSVIFYIQSNFIFIPKLYWNEESVEWSDILIFIVTFFIIALVSWLSNREMEKSLERARSAEKDLQKERDMLEIKVEEKARELKEAQVEKMLQMYRFAEFGKMAAGLFHDLMNPLTAAILNIDSAKEKRKKEGKNAGDLKKIADSIQRARIFAEAARKQIYKEEKEIESNKFSLSKEILAAMQTFFHKARRKNVEIIFEKPKNDIKINGDAIHFYRVICDLLSNAIDVYPDKQMTGNNYKIAVSIDEDKEHNGVCRVVVQDWGCGIPKENLQRIFEPLFTTKSFYEGTGLGLFVVKHSIENYFNGNIEVESKEGEGTKFSVILPKRGRV